MSFDSRAVSISLVVLATIGVFYVLVVGKAFLVPLAVAIMIWYVINALSRTYAKLLPGKKQSNWITTTASLLSIGLLLTLAVDMVQGNIADVTRAAPEYKANFDRMSAQAIERFNLGALPNVKQMAEGIEVAPIISKLAGSFTNMISNIFLVLLYVLFLMLEQGTFQKKMIALLPNKARRESVTSILRHAQEDIQTYLWIKTLTSATTGLVSYFVLRLVDVDFAGFWAFTIFLLNYIPTIGSIVATFFPALIALIQFNTATEFFIVLIAVGAIQVVVGNFMEPKLMGSSLNLSPLVVMLSLTLWGSLWGVAGMFLSVPITVMMLIVFAHFERTRYLAILLSGDGSLKFAKEHG
ncbi:MAG: AI-2E family transporter [Gammaproteobacteria bacterium]|nr:AI-2E family transporter [Gammaproteobacteria bacterium]